MKTQPYRIYRRTGQQKRCSRKDGKKTYIKIKKLKTIPDRNLVTVMLTTTKMEGTKLLAYTQGIAPKLVLFLRTTKKKLRN